MSTMPSEVPAFGFGFMGVVFALLTFFALWRGSIRESSDIVIYRSNDPMRYYILVVFCVLLATVFIAASTYFFLHPGLVAVSDSGPD